MRECASSTGDDSGATQKLFSDDRRWVNKPYASGFLTLTADVLEGALIGIVIPKS